MADQAGHMEVERPTADREGLLHPNPLPEGEGTLGPDSGRRQRSGLAGLVADYVALMKPPIISLLLVTAIGGMFLAAEGVPNLLTLLLVCVGGTLGAGGANAINHYLDQDIDALMSRTAQRPVPANRVRPMMALSFGIALNVVAFGVLFYWVNWMAAALTLTATLFYVLVYTSWLKRSTPQNIVIGGAAGSFPPEGRSLP